MSDQHYAPPQADLSSSNIDISSLLEPLRATKGWVRLCSIIGFIGCGFTVLAALLVMVGGSTFQTAMAGQPGIGAGVGVAYLLFALLYFFPSLYLFKYASKIGNALESQNINDIADALEQQKSFWKFAGIVVLIMLIFFVLGVGSAILIPLMMMG